MDLAQSLVMRWSWHNLWCWGRAITTLQVISSSQFKLFLELEPQLREVLQCFYDSRSAPPAGPHLFPLLTVL